ncbi:EKC/KEOPS complex subunit TP53RK [Pieris rapae]|uniref:EKC/KEOPS complex subunit TP53RK n=1 Tax=Pieris rapae TaxID=64459 RepID=UPI001E27CAE6|nr:EKC/KEOPS complex subunit TP53RK [Pieris rapae]
MCEEFKLLKQGAEAKLLVCNYLGKPTLIKERFQKNYRHPDLDETITKERIKNEARSIVRCKTIGVKTPTLYLVDFDRRRIYMQHFENSITAKDFIINTKKLETGDGSENLNILSKKIGETVRKLHENSIIHGDLTTSNILLIEKNTSNDLKSLEQDNIELVMIDFGLSHTASNAEDMGVDLYVLERAIISTHNDCPDLFPRILESYKTIKTKNKSYNIKEVINKFEEVRARGRKRTMVG